jgi:23S rRNA pseudouridine1911/1915/1917 synthase
MIKGVTTHVQESGVRLDAALLNLYPSTTRAFVRDAIEGGRVLVNGRKSVKGFKLKGGERIDIEELLETADNKVAPVLSQPVKTVFEDDAILALDKPAGMPVQPLSCRETGTLMNGVVARYPEVQGVGDDPLMAGALHRIDAGTSGLVLVAKTEEAFANLRAQFSAHKVEKKYLAMVEGSVAVGGTLINSLAHDPTLPFCRMIDSSHNRLTLAERAKLKAMPAETRFEPVGHTTEVCEERTLLEVTIFTGVTHQIRAQLAMAGHHIINDTLYGAFAVENMIGHYLHALSAKFVHPVSGEEVVVSTRYPDWAAGV